MRDSYNNYYVHVFVYQISYIKINGRRTTETSNTQANKGSPLLSEEVPYQITLIRCSRGGLDRRGEKVIWEMLTENDCNTSTDLKGKS